jgi:endonuclease-3
VVIVGQFKGDEWNVHKKKIYFFFSGLLSSGNRQWKGLFCLHAALDSIGGGQRECQLLGNFFPTFKPWQLRPQPNQGRFMTVSSGTKQHAATVAKILGKEFPQARCELDFQTPLQLLIAVILSAQCTDVRVNQVTKSLFHKYPDAAAYAQASLKELERDIQSTGFYHNKAKSIQSCSQALLERYEGDVPEDMEKLVELPGIGRKTANVVLGTAYGIASGIVVDTHVTRVSQRLGLTEEKNPEKIEQDLLGQFPQKEWIALSHRLVHLGRYVCTARKPKCDVCPLGKICPKIGV